MSIESVEFEGIKYAEIIWADTEVKETTFYSPAESSFQFGLLAHESGFVESPHYHKDVKRQIDDFQQMLLVQNGVLIIELYSDAGDPLRGLTMKAGDAIVLIHGVHAIRVIEDMQCISVKQGPYMGEAEDKVFVDVKA